MLVKFPIVVKTVPHNWAKTNEQNSQAGLISSLPIDR